MFATLIAGHTVLFLVGTHIAAFVAGGIFHAWVSAEAAVVEAEIKSKL
jgi:hypothetical protein